mgnify:FL=1
MENKIKLVWRFSGINALQIANHHLVHINEYSEKENLKIINSGTQEISEFSSISFIVVPKDILNKIKNDLKPHHSFPAND